MLGVPRLPENWIGLADAIRELRRELTDAMADAQDESIRFELGMVEMEFLLNASRDTGGEAGVRFWVVSLGGRGSVSSGSTHRVKLSLTPKDASGMSPEIADTEDAAETGKTDTKPSPLSGIEHDPSNEETR